MSPLIEVRNASFIYPNGFQAVKDVSFTVEPGDNIAIIGQNGAGKTTTVKMLNGLLKPSAGDVFVEGENTRDKTTAQVSKSVAYVFQNPDDQIFNNTVFDEIAYALRKKNLTEEEVSDRVHSAAEICDIQETLDENPYDLPLSIRKLITIAAVVATDAQVFIFDEPTAGQDMHGLKVLTQVIQHLLKNDKAVITITHDMEYVIHHFDEIIVMADKQIRAHGNCEEIFYDRALMDLAMLTPPTLVQVYQELLPGETSLDIERLAEHLKNF